MKNIFFGPFLVFLTGSLPISVTPVFAAGDPPEVALAKMVDRAYESGERAGYVFDLDETIVDSTPRRFYSVLEALDRICGSTRLHADCGFADSLRLKGLYQLRNRYDDHVFLRAAGMQDPKFVDQVLDEALTVYLSGAYIVEEDRLYPGVQAFIRELKRAGARVFFVSSRSEEKQLRPTLEFLRRRGLIGEGESNTVYLKRQSEKSGDFKRGAVEDIRVRMERGEGRVVGIFENEPENLSIWSEVFPRAKAFFVLGAYLKNGPIPSKSVVLDDFRY